MGGMEAMTSCEVVTEVLSVTDKNRFGLDRVAKGHLLTV